METQERQTDLILNRWTDIKHILVDYLIKGRNPGHFLYAVLANDLTDAVCFADPSSLALLKATVKLVYNELSSMARGSKKRVNLWMEQPHPGIRAEFEFKILNAELSNYDSALPFDSIYAKR